MLYMLVKNVVEKINYPKKNRLTLCVVWVCAISFQGCHFISKSDENSRVIRKKKPEITNLIEVRILSYQEGLVTRSKLVRSTVVGTEFFAKSKINQYEHRFEGGPIVEFSSSKGVIKITCDGPSAFGSWPFFPGGELLLKNGSRKKIIGAVSAAGKIIDNEKIVSQDFLETDKSFDKYGFKFIEYKIVTK